MRKVLIITYYFPPAGGAGVQRTLKFIKYLHEFGWQPVVLTADRADYPAYDESLAAEVPPEVRVYRASLFEPYRFYRRFTGRPAAESTDIAVLSLDENRKQKWTERVSEFIRAAFFIPDARIGWLRPAVRLGRKIIEQEGIEAILSSAPPYTTHLIGRRLQRSSKLPWIADFRDSWIGWLSAPQWRPAFSRAIERRMEARVLAQADRILCVTRGVQEDLLSRHPSCRDERWHYLPNGYDAADFKGIRPATRDRRIVLTYTGSMYGHRNPSGLLRAMEEMLRRDPRLEKRLTVRLVGRVGEAIWREISASPAAGLFQQLPYVTHAESLGYLLVSDAALLIIDEAPANRGIVTGKFFEYLGARLPIVALAPEGEAADLIRRHRLGWVARTDDIPAIIAILERLIERGKKKKIRIAEKQLLQFERRQQTKNLTALLDELIDERNMKI